MLKELVANLFKQMGTSGWEFLPNSRCTSNDASLFSSSLPVLAHEKCESCFHLYTTTFTAFRVLSVYFWLVWFFIVNGNGVKSDLKSKEDASTSSNDVVPKPESNKFLEDVVGSLLPDDEDELLADIMDGFDANWLANGVDESEEYDLFGSGGGLELESDPQENSRVGVSSYLSSSDDGNGVAHLNQTNGAGTITGEHPLGEHPSRTLFVRNINSNVDDAELRTLFEVFLTCKKLLPCYVIVFLGIPLH